LPATTRAFIIGDLERGITIVVIDPVMVVHYSIDELKNGLPDGSGNANKGENTTKQMAMLVRELIPILRGVPLDDLDAVGKDIENNASPLTQLQIRKALEEIDFAQTIAKIVNAKGSVSTVDFCIGLDITPGDYSAMVRNVDPGKKIGEYLKDNATKDQQISNRPITLAKYPIDKLSSDGLTIPDAWKGP
jgi:hypothetical protein